MPQAIPFIKAAGVVIGKVLATKTAIGITYGTIAKIAVTAGTVAYSRAQSRKAKRQLRTLQDQGSTATFADPVSSRKLIYGEVRAGGTVVFAHTNGAKNNVLHQVICIAKKPVSEIGDTFFGDEDLGNYWGSGSGPAPSSPYYNHAWIYKNRGETGLADAYLVANAPEVWTTDHKIAGVANIYVELVWDQEVYPQGASFNISTMVKGHAVHDPRDSSDGFSRNPALILRDYLTEEMKVPVGDIDDASVIAAANICDETVNGEPRYTCNIVLDTADSPADNRAKIAGCMAGWCKKIGGKWYMEAGAHKSSSLSITFANLRGEVQIQAQDDVSQSFNAVRGIWLSPEANWQPVDAPVVFKKVSAPNIVSGTRVTIIETGSTDFTLIGAPDSNPGTTFTASGAGTGTGTVDPYLGADNGIRRFLDVELHGCTNQPEALRRMRIILEEGRHELSAVLPMNLSGYLVKAGDYIDVTEAKLGWTNKLFKVVRHHRRWETGENDAPLLGVDLEVREVSSAIYAHNTDDDTSADPAPNTDSQSPLEAPEPPTSLSLSSGTTELLLGSDGTIISRILAEWTMPADPYVTSGGRIEVQYKPSAEADWITAATVLGDDEFTYIAPVEDAVDYDVRIRSRNGLGKVSAWVTSSNHTVAGKTTAPTAPDNLTATAAAGAIILEWDNPPDADLASNLIWISASNTFPGGAPDFIVPAAPNTQGRFRIEPLSGGTTRYAWVATRDTSSNDSSTQEGPASATALSGTAGSDAYTVVFDMPAAVVACDSSGNAISGELGPGGRVRTNIYVTKGTASLTATTGTPGAGEYRISLNGSVTNGTATFSTYTVRLDTATADTGNVPVKVELESTTVFFALNWPFTKAKQGTTGANGTNGSGYGGTSSTFNTIGTGSKTFYIGTGYAYVVGSRVRVASSASPTNWVEGVVSAYSSGNLTLTSDITGGSGSYSSWTVSLAGAEGDTGPGIVYRGAYVSGGTYFHTTTRRDVVSYSGSYYLADNPSKSGLTTWGTPGVSDWTTFGATFSSVATDILLTVDATILKTLVMGDGTTADAGVIRSVGATGPTSGNGYYLNPRSSSYSNAAVARIGNPSGAYILWDGSELKINGDKLSVVNSLVNTDDAAYRTWQGSISANRGIYIQRKDGLAPTLALHSAGSAPSIQFTSYGGTSYSSPSATQSGLNCRIDWSGHDGTTTRSIASIFMRTLETVSSTAAGSQVIFQSNDTGTISSKWAAFQGHALLFGDIFGLTRVLRDRRTGWAVPSGTLTRTTFDAGTVTLAQLAERVAALITDLHDNSGSGHGLIGT